MRAPLPLLTTLSTALSSTMLAAGLLLAAPAHAATLTPEQQALHVLNRLGYGPAPGDVQRVVAMGVDNYIDAQLHPEQHPLPPDLAQRFAALDNAEASPRTLLAEFRPLGKKGDMAKGDDAQARQDARREAFRDAALAAESDRLERAVYSPHQLEEVMTDFWFNHFNVFAGKGLTRVFLTDYERNAIRPYVLGHFRDLLEATAKHPAMLFYLDNWQSTAPGYQPRHGGKNQPTGLNENYAREVMELHTLGVDGGYTQKDVTELARMLTGWTFNPRDARFGDVTFRFDPERHDDGGKNWLNHHVDPRGQAEGEWALDVLASSPATAHHISYQLAQYFVADDPPATLVDKLSHRYLATQGDIRAVLGTLFASKEFWDSANSANKFKTPYQYVVSAVRASGLPVSNIKPMAGALRQLGMPLYGCQTPDGYKNTEAAWLNADALTKRISFATALGSGRMPLDVDPNSDQGKPLDRGDATPVDAAALANTLGPTLSDKTRSTIAAAAPPLRAALMLGSPDFQRR